MTNYRLTRRARRDVLEIWQHIGENSEQAADRFVDLLIHYFELLGENPGAGRRRDDLRQGYRSFPVGSYLVFYRVAPQSVYILHVVHARREINRLLGH